MSDSASPWTATRQASLFFTICRRLLKLMSIELVMLSNHLVICHPLFLLPSIFPSIRVFSNESVLRIRWPKYWSFSFSKGRGNRDQIANIHWIIEKLREVQKNIYFCFINYTKVFDCMDHNKLWKILKEMGMLDHLTCLLRGLYAGQEATFGTRHGTTDWFKTGKGVCQGCMSPYFF